MIIDVYLCVFQRLSGNYSSYMSIIKTSRKQLSAKGPISRFVQHLWVISYLVHTNQRLKLNI
ncbi:hypothetical protein BC833DRAFT_602837 [Globomyces pollinis-pini]|nr:hypothetical protein BC833DRAFT_602837 [Globomyces pollinis-pini]